MTLIRKYGPLISIGLIVLALGFLFLPYVRAGFENRYYAIGYHAIFNIKESGLTSTTTREGNPSAMLIIAFVLMACSLVALPFYKKDIILPFISGIALFVAGIIFFFAHLILIVNLGGAPISGTFGLYLVASLVTLSGAASFFCGLQGLKEAQNKAREEGFSYLRK